MVQGRRRNYHTIGIAAVHYVEKPTADSTKGLGGTLNRAVILRTKARGTKIKAVSLPIQTLTTKGEGVARGKRSVVFEPNWAVHPMPFPSPAPLPGLFPPPPGRPIRPSSIEGRAKVSSSKGETTVKKQFMRHVYYAQKRSARPRVLSLFDSTISLLA